MYRSMRPEINLGRLRPHATCKFMTQIGNHTIGKESERIFFIKRFGLHKVNMRNFANAKEIIPTQWTVEGNGRVDEDDYANNRIDPQHIPTAPPSQHSKLKDLNERRFWIDQVAVDDIFLAERAGAM